MRISDWSSDVCSSDLCVGENGALHGIENVGRKDAVVKSLGRLARDRAQIEAGPDELVELVGDDPGWLVVQSQASSDRTRQRHGRIGRAAWRERVCQAV